MSCWRSQQGLAHCCVHMNGVHWKLAKPNAYQVKLTSIPDNTSLKKTVVLIKLINNTNTESHVLCRKISNASNVLKPTRYL